jgi:LAS superfamily LD-carboxypeptidase LdcB
MKWIKLFETFVYEDITITPKNTPKTKGPNNPTSTTSTTTQKPTTTNTTTPVDNTDILSTYLNGNLELIKIYQEIEKKLNDKFTEDHFKKEIKITGGLKRVSNGMNPNTLAKFQKMKKEVPSLEISSLSHRSLKTQQEMFINIAKKRGGKIIKGLQQASLPGFSQHHTGKSIDVINYKKIPDNHQEFYKKYGFELPYPTYTGFRIAEPWHIVDNS